MLERGMVGGGRKCVLLTAADRALMRVRSATWRVMRAERCALSERLRWRRIGGAGPGRAAPVPRRRSA